MVKQESQEDIVVRLNDAGYVAKINPTDEETVFISGKKDSDYKFSGTDEELREIKNVLPIDPRRISFFNLGTWPAYFRVHKKPYENGPWFYRQKECDERDAEYKRMKAQQKLV